MINSRLALLVSIRDSNANENVRFLDINYLPSIATGRLSSGELVALDFFGNELDSNLAVEIINGLTIASNETRSESLNDLDKFLKQSAWNIYIAPLVIATVRSDVMYSPRLGDTVDNILQSLQKVIYLTQLGMFSEASQVISTITPTPFLTVDRLELYSNMLISANAIK